MRMSSKQQSKGTSVFCSICKTDFQIKSSKNRFSKKITGAEYNTTLHNVINGNNPSLMLLYYDEKTMMVVGMEMVQKEVLYQMAHITQLLKWSVQER